MTPSADRAALERDRRELVELCELMEATPMSEAGMERYAYVRGRLLAVEQALGLAPSRTLRVGGTGWWAGAREN